MSAADVRKLHSPFNIYCECDHDAHEDEPEHHQGRPVIYIEELGYTCAEPTQTVCYECDTDDGEVNEYTQDGKYPCETLKELEKPDGRANSSDQFEEIVEAVRDLIANIRLGGAMVNEIRFCEALLSALDVTDAAREHAEFCTSPVDLRLVNALAAFDGEELSAPIPGGASVSDEQETGEVS